MKWDPKSIKVPIPTTHTIPIVLIIACIHKCTQKVVDNCIYINTQ